jgi:hypothetical protein
MITIRNPRRSTTARDHAPPIRDYLTSHRFPPRITTRNLWHTDASSMQDTAPPVASTRWELPC